MKPFSDQIFGIWTERMADSLYVDTTSLQILSNLNWNRFSQQGHKIPVSAIPCLNYRKGLDKEREAAESQGGQPAALVETPMVTEEASTVTKDTSTATKETSTVTNETQVVTVETPMAPTSDNVSGQTNGPADPNASTGWGSLFNILNALA